MFLMCIANQSICFYLSSQFEEQRLFIYRDLRIQNDGVIVRVMQFLFFLNIFDECCYEKH